MANDERQSEQFIREVDEELRRAQLKSIWDRFAPLIIGVCVLVVLITAGYRGWLWWEERQAAAAGDRFMAAMEAIETGDRAAGEAEIARIAAEGRGGYAALARLRLAGEKAAAGSKAEALAAYDAVAADASVAATLRDVARIRAALLALDAGDVVGATERATPLEAAGNPWRHAAREVLGMAAYKSGDMQKARDYFAAIQQDAETPADLWYRSGMMVALIDGQLAAPGTEGEARPAPDAAAPATLEVPASEAPAADLTPRSAAEPATTLAPSAPAPAVPATPSPAEPVAPAPATSQPQTVIPPQ